MTPVRFRARLRRRDYLISGGGAQCGGVSGVDFLASRPGAALFGPSEREEAAPTP